MVRNDAEFVCRNELEEVLTHPAGANGVTARQLLDEGFSEVSSLVDLGVCHEPSPHQVCDLCRVRLMPLRDQKPRSTLDRVLTHDVHQHKKSGGLAVTTCTFHEKHHLFRHHSRHAIPKETMDERHHFRVFLRSKKEKFIPKRAFCVRLVRYFTDFSYQVRAIVILEFPCP